MSAQSLSTHPEVTYVPVYLFQWLQSIDKSLADLLAKTLPPITEQDDNVEAEEAAKMIHLGMDRFYAIHKTILTSSKPGKKLLFSRKQIQAYLESKKAKPAGAAIKEAEDFRINRLRKS